MILALSRLSIAPPVGQRFATDAVRTGHVALKLRLWEVLGFPELSEGKGFMNDHRPDC